MDYPILILLHAAMTDSRFIPIHGGIDDFDYINCTLIGIRMIILWSDPILYIVIACTHSEYLGCIYFIQSED